MKVDKLLSLIMFVEIKVEKLYVKKHASHYIEGFEEFFKIFNMSVEEVMKFVEFVVLLDEANFRWRLDIHYILTLLLLTLKNYRPYTMEVVGQYFDVRKQRFTHCYKEIMKKLNYQPKIWSKKQIIEWMRKRGFINKKETQKISQNWVRKYNSEIKNFFSTINKLEKEGRMEERDWREFTILKMRV